MSAPDTNVEKQEKRHKPALLGIKGAVLFGGLMLLLVIFFSVMRADEPTPTGAEGSSVDVDTVAPGTNESN